jgi:hypothetical protein
MAKRIPYTQPTNDDQAHRKSVLLGLASPTGPTSGFDKSEALKLLPEELRTEGQACADLRQFFPGGVPELREKLEDAQRSVEAALAVINSIDKTVW